MNISHLKSLSAILVAASILTPIAGHCAEPGPQIRVAIADVNLSSPQGIANLYSRLRHAADAVFGGEPGNRELERRDSWSKCVHTALDGAVVQVHSVALAALHAQKVGRTSLLLASTSAPERR